MRHKEAAQVSVEIFQDDQKCNQHGTSLPAPIAENTDLATRQLLIGVFLM